MKKITLRPSSQVIPRRAYSIDYAAKLNSEQLRAVFHENGPALVLAGAGTGKTRTLTYRVARLVEDGYDPSRILLLTFTKKAAQEMIGRASTLLAGRCDKVAGGTFHAFAWRTIQRFAPQEPNAARFTVMDQSDANDAMGLVRSRFDVRTHKRRFPSKEALQAIYSKAVNKARPLSEIIELEYPGFVEYSDMVVDVIRAYTEYKIKHNILDYDDLLLRLLSLSRDPLVGEHLKRQYAMIMVDEYQDVNPIQHQIVLALAGNQGNVMAVGDDAQSIYSFRGADVRNIHSFPSEFQSCQIIRMEENYRSTQEILDVANCILDEAPNAFKKTLWSSVDGGELPIRVQCRDERQQSEFVAQQILEYREMGVALSEIAVLFRSGHLSFDLEIELSKVNIPFRKVGGLRFTEASHIKDLLALIKLTVNARDAVSWYRVLCLLEGVGSKTASRIIETVVGHDTPLEALREEKTTKAAVSIGGLMDVVRAAHGTASPGECARLLAGWYKGEMERIYDDSQRRWKDVESLVAIASGYRSTGAFLDDVALDPPNEALQDIDDGDGEAEFVTLSTIHSAKGLEWKVVFGIWINEGTLPSSKAAGDALAIEEERRLLYVLCTRAERQLILSYPAVMASWERGEALGLQSRFLDPIASERSPMFTVEIDEGPPLPAHELPNNP